MSVAFVGAGRRSLASARMLAGSGVGKPVAFWNRSTQAADQAAAEFSVPRYDSVETMVADRRPDLVAIMTHPTARVELVSAAVRAGGRAILIEKPIALRPADLARIEEETQGRFVMVNTQYQWMPHWQRLLGLIADGALGELLHIRASVGVDILEQGPHALSLSMAAASAAGLPSPRWVLAGGSGSLDFGGVSIPAESTALFDLGDARLALTAGLCSPPVRGETVRAFQQQTEIIGSLGRIWVSLNQGAELWREGSFEAIATEWNRDDQASQTAMFDDIARALDDQERQSEFPTRLELAAAQARMLFGAIESVEAPGMQRLDSGAP